ncbi:octopamine receptor beta-2R-like [Clavelina lepadiformis]|uniref:G-protein coupled receptors family 1 profile domain-containing protein n=1 Tax=Clavelina lepadiformis TaxID=159417 RepID=A0ABP0GR45_CLALP
MAGGAVILLLAVSLGLAILTANALTMLVGIRRCRRGKANKLDICRSSLALADALTSVQPLVVVPYNFSWSMNMMPEELDKMRLALRGSPQAYVGGISYLLGITASMNHLAYMAIERFYAVAKPFNYRWQSKKSVYVGLAMTWILSAIAIFLMTFFQEWTFDYSATLFVFFPSQNAINLERSRVDSLVPLAVLYFLPYISNSVLIVGTAVMICRRQKVGGNGLQQKHSNSQRNRLQQNNHALFSRVFVFNCIINEWDNRRN